MSSMGPMIGALFQAASSSPKDNAKTKKKAAPKKEVKAKVAVVEHVQPAETVREYKEPTPAERVKSHAKEAKVSATRQWIEGRMKTEEHNNIHARANHVLEEKAPARFKGKSGDRKDKHLW